MKEENVLNEAFSYSVADVKRLWNEINNISFDGTLNVPKIFLESNFDHLVPAEYLAFVRKTNPNAEIMGFCDEDPEDHDTVLLIANHITDPVELIQVVAHEMVHQAIAEEKGYSQMEKIGHNAEFMAYAEKIKKYHHTSLIGKEY